MWRGETNALYRVEVNIALSEGERSSDTLPVSYYNALWFIPESGVGIEVY
jgi:hypothetical protein